MPEASWSRSLDEVGPPRRIGWSPTLGYARVDTEVRAICEAALDALANQGTEVVLLDQVFDADPAPAWIRLAMTSSLRAVEHLRGTPQWELLDPEHVLMMEAFGASTTALQLLAANDECHRLNHRLVELFHDVSVICTPTVAGQAGPVGGQGSIDGEETPYWVSFTYPFNMTRSPAGNVCAGFTAAGLPVGLQVIGPQHADVAVLRAIAALEDTLGHDRLAPV
jgi:aspartyl-tRNA(Asn)/glutamyl-tRNA(Gln) amidotransferase subunit A